MYLILPVFDLCRAGEACEGLPNPLAQPLPVNLLFAAMLTMVVGLIAAWKWERIGGILILGGLACFGVVNHGIPFNVVFGPMLAVGLLFLLCGWMRRWKARPSRLRQRWV